MSPPNLSLVFIMICFWVTLWIVYRYLLVPVGRVLAERQGRIESAASEWQSKHDDYLRATDRLEKEMEGVARDTAQIRAEHRQRALDQRQQVLDAARASADDKLHKALEVLDTDATQARDDLRQSASELARLFAGRLLQREV